MLNLSNSRMTKITEFKTANCAILTIVYLINLQVLMTVTLYITSVSYYV